MSGALIAVLLATAFGIPIAAALDRDADYLALLGEAILLGIALLAASLFAMEMAGLSPSRTEMLLVAFAVSALSIRPGAFRARPKLGVNTAALVIAAIVIVLLAGYALFATVAPASENDFIADWGMKGRAFFEARGIDWRVLENAIHHDAHPSYPLFLPLSFDAVALMNGGWDARGFGVLYVAWAAALLMICASLAARERGSAWQGALDALILVPFAATPWIGLGEGPLVAYATAGVLLVRRDALLPGAVLLGIAGCYKNEGALFVAAVAIALLVAGQARKIPRLWPAAALIAPWWIVRARHALPSSGWADGGEIVRRLAHPAEAVARLTEFVGKPLYWVGVLLAVVLLAKVLVREERFALAVIVIVAAAYVAVPFVSSFPVEHAKWGGLRLVAHLTPLLTFVLTVRLLPLTKR